MSSSRLEEIMNSVDLVALTVRAHATVFSAMLLRYHLLSTEDKLLVDMAANVICDDGVVEAAKADAKQVIVIKLLAD